MVKFTVLGANGRTLLGIGLSQENLDRLKQGQPIIFTSEEISLPWKADILIMFGNTESDMKKELKPFLGPDTQVIDKT